ncbi:unnamed protein product [Urochloa humidicola]
MLQSVAYLRQIWWFEVVGEVDFCFPVGTYSLYFRVHLGSSTNDLAATIAAQTMSMAGIRSMSTSNSRPQMDDVNKKLGRNGQDLDQ